MNRAGASDPPGCGSTLFPDITLQIQTTTGGNFSITVNSKHTVENLKKIMSKKLKVSKDRIYLLHREQQLRNGTMEENGIIDGSRVILLPSVETGLLTHRPENSVMQALESLNDSQVNDFLSGKSPLNLTMRLGDHMMLIQLQLSTLQGAGGGGEAGAARVPPGPAAPNAALRRAARPPAPAPPAPPAERRLRSFLDRRDVETLQSAFRLFESLADMRRDDGLGPIDEEAPIHSLSEFVASPLAAVAPRAQQAAAVATLERALQDPLYARARAPPPVPPPAPRADPRAAPPPGPPPAPPSPPPASAPPPPSPPPPATPASPAPSPAPSQRGSGCSAKRAAPEEASGARAAKAARCEGAAAEAVPDARALAEASQNLTQTLKKLSREVLAGKARAPREGRAGPSRCPSSAAAAVDSMKHHGEGIYSGTFSGTLNPALQDSYGRPKRDISTIIHILNDLLCAAPAKIGDRGGAEAGAAPAPEGRREGCSACGEGAGGAGGGCAACRAARALALDNRITRRKLERLRLLMRREKQRRQAARRGPDHGPLPLPIPLPHPIPLPLPHAHAHPHPCGERDAEPERRVGAQA